MKETLTEKWVVLKSTDYFHQIKLDFRWYNVTIKSKTVCFE